MCADVHVYIRVCVHTRVHKGDVPRGNRNLTVSASHSSEVGTGRGGLYPAQPSGSKQGNHTLEREKANDTIVKLADWLLTTPDLEPNCKSPV